MNYSSLTLTYEVVMSDWDDRFMNIKQNANALPRTISNHSSVELQCGNWRGNKWYFKSETIWLSGFPDYVLSCKLKLLKQKLNEWNIDSLAIWRKGWMIEEGKLTGDQLVEKAGILLEIQEVAKLEGIFWRQRSRCNVFDKQKFKDEIIEEQKASKRRFTGRYQKGDSDFIQVSVQRNRKLEAIIQSCVQESLLRKMNGCKDISQRRMKRRL
ncbi:hypothetical protein H5410_006322 [Solanum commersonii]|uniref:Uncharacterized protein n=1 Tax=Solanum commersonii TaxID=4109 RepID=A0A9J6A9J6_SOLCO|nr:hypothetical protein H5410_006322 [Solanum commersonii]